MYRDLNLPPMSNLSLQQQKEYENRTERDYITRSLSPPIPAPIPTRAAIAPMQPVLGPQVGIWSPEIGIRFGGSAPENTPP